MNLSVFPGVHHVCMKVRDIQKSVDFYVSQLGYTVRLQWDGGAMLKSPDGTHLEFFPVDEEEGYSHVAYICKDVDKAYAELLENGCTSVSAPESLTIPSDPALPVRIAFVRDPAGNKIELFKEL
ncbi:VOC family protein [Ethanoligenens harbinense]|uniref:Glyoxalase/bleomycin resistance protein/dioxygenase n=1 Tax=Ethanoligenens harbinense (strain DSM 18485 / JCM 12961 / CGMCC 1.5033 / YUAN-3) TaxID=663278 RepID=E6U752_ETHHY|nr:VOC family protein [Ethanoligenens harbinense]ADU28122.1 Glyoxalase/bleomycin resistance protein/dioxygenase [Ethanoligenens harbinense YUAN-3]AVQ97130.1 VOC family protein [Ethanoligenens harbinense YUAN-3]AYF39792.1 VOC family protein [Ethanoligenens harbinense]AYF42624.1 VOC family protein [Ethanoligenens harbinense]QCN93373.1 VOC family protein [Ethanoligenens harbinense]